VVVAANDLQRDLLMPGLLRQLPGFAGLPPLLLGSSRLATAPSLLRRGLLRGLSRVAPPLPCPELPMYLVWHLRHQADPLHRWLRQLVKDSVAPALAAAQPD
jgi:DNA-binding transcriptional LysR family regulator